MEHREQWLRTFTEGLERHNGDEVAAALDCGRWCAALGAIQAARAACEPLGAAPSVSVVVAALNERGIGGGDLQLREGAIVGTYKSCLCPLREDMVKQYPSFCNCTRGWSLAVFEDILGHPVTVELTHAIGMGDDHCEFVVSPSAPV